MDPVTHFELPADDRERVKKFYSSVFGWQLQQMGPEMGEYVLAGTTPVDENQMAKVPGQINGGIFMRGQDPEATVPTVVIQVADLDESMKKVTGAGGKIIGEPQDIPGVGRWVSFRDTENNRVGMMQPGRP